MKKCFALFCIMTICILFVSCGIGGISSTNSAPEETTISREELINEAILKVLEEEGLETSFDDKTGKIYLSFTIDNTSKNLAGKEPSMIPVMANQLDSTIGILKTIASDSTYDISDISITQSLLTNDSKVFIEMESSYPFDSVMLDCPLRNTSEVNNLSYFLESPHIYYCGEIGMVSSFDITIHCETTTGMYGHNIWSGNKFFSPSEGKEFAIIYLDVINVGAQEASFYPHKFKLYVDNVSVEYTNDLAIDDIDGYVHPYLSHNNQLENIMSGKGIKTYIPLEIPEGWQKIELYYPSVNEGYDAVFIISPDDCA